MAGSREGRTIKYFSISFLLILIACNSHHNNNINNVDCIIEEIEEEQILAKLSNFDVGVISRGLNRIIINHPDTTSLVFRALFKDPRYSTLIDFHFHNCENKYFKKEYISISKKLLSDLYELGIYQFIDYQELNLKIIYTNIEPSIGDSGTYLVLVNGHGSDRQLKRILYDLDFEQSKLYTYNKEWSYYYSDELCDYLNTWY